jgi:CheY-like chemotaxis protein
MTDPSAPPRVLLVEDDMDDRLFFERALKKAGYGWTLVTAMTGREAIEYLSGVGRFSDRTAYPIPSYVLLDLKLPEISGLEVLEWIRKHPSLRTLPVIVLSSSRETSDLERATKLGIDAYEVKSVEFAALVSTVRSIARRWQFSDEPSP